MVVACDIYYSNSTNSNIVSITTKDETPPIPPTGLVISESTYNSLKLSWDANPEEDIIGYYLYRSMISNGSFEKIGFGSKLITKNHFLDPNLDEDTKYFYKIKAVDDANLESRFSEIINGTTLVNQHPPEVNNSITEIKIYEDIIDYTSLNLYHLFKDANNDPLTFVCEGQELINITIIQKNGSVILRPEENWSGSEKITFYASDMIHYQICKQEVIIHVLPVNDPPDIPIITAPKGDSQINDGETLDFMVKCSDPDLEYGDKLTFSWSSNISGKLGNGEILKSILLPIGIHSVFVEVEDSKGEISSSSIQIRVLETNLSDSDDDGMPNIWERKYGLDPNNPRDNNLDPDNDEIYNFDEFIFGTDPKSRDTDSDGLDDKTELFTKRTNATNPDTDGDGHVDGYDAYPLDNLRWKKEEEKPPEVEKPTKHDDNTGLYLIAGIIVVIIVILLLFLFVLKPRMGKKAKEEEDVKDAPEKKTTPGTPKSTQKPTLPQQLKQQPQQKTTDIKSLMLKGSQAYSKRNYTDAILAWQQVLEKEPEQHPDIEMAIKDAMGKMDQS